MPENVPIEPHTDVLEARLRTLRARDAELAAAVRRLRAEPTTDPAEVARLLRERANAQYALAAYERLQQQLQRAFSSEHPDGPQETRIFRPQSRDPAHETADLPVLDGGLYTPKAVYTGAYEAIDVLFVNGILVDFGAFQRALHRVAERMSGVVVGLYNATDDAVQDIWQATNDRAQAWLAVRLDTSNPAVQRLAKVVSQIGQRAHERTLTLIGHSQGGAILSAALNTIARKRPDHMPRLLQVYTLGSFGVDFPAGPRYHFFAHQFDPVPALAQAHFFPGSIRPDAQMRYFANLTVLRGPLDPREAHSMAAYLANWEAFVAEEDRIRQGGVLQRLLGQAGEVVQFQTNPWGVLARLGGPFFGGVPQLS